MAEYRIYMFRNGHIERAESIDVEDDAAAFNHASISAGGEAFEVWRGAQMIVSVDAPVPDVSAAAG